MPSLWPFNRVTRAARLTGGIADLPVETGIALEPWVDRSHINAVVISDVLGVDVFPVSRAEAMTVPAFANCRHTVCAAALLPWSVNDASGADVTAAAAWVLEPNPIEPRYQLALWTLDDLVFYGSSFWLVLGRYATISPVSDRGYPRLVTRLEWTEVTIDADTSTIRYGDDEVDPADLIVVAGPHEGVINFGGRTVRSGARIENAAARIADNPVPLVELHNLGQDLTNAEIDALVGDWLPQRLKQTGGVGYTNAATELRVHGTPASELIASERAQVALDAARLVGLPASSIDAPVSGGSTLTYDNPESRLFMLLNMGLSAYITAITARLSMGDVLPRGQVLTIDPRTLSPAAAAPTDTAAPAAAPAIDTRPAV